MDRDDLRGLSHRSACPRPFTSDWEYCQRHGLNNLAEMKAYQSCSAQQTFNVKPISSRTRQPPPRAQTSQPPQGRACKRGQNADTHTNVANVNIPGNDDGNLAKKILRRSHSHSDVSLQSINLSEGPESSSAPVSPVGGTLNQLRVHIRNYTALYEGSVGTDVTAKGVYSEMDLKINILNVELRKAITNLQKPEIRLELTALGHSQ